MKLSWKLFFLTTPVFVLFLTVFGNWMIQTSFRSSLEQEIERCMAENQMFSNSYDLTRHSLSESQWNMTSVQKVVESFHQKHGAEEGSFRIYKADGEVLYQDNGLKMSHDLLEKLEEPNNVGYQIGRLGEDTYIVVLGKSSFGDYIETTKNISQIYKTREMMYARYQMGVLLLTILVGGVILLVLFFVMRNMQNLSSATRQFARGKYDVRVQIKSTDEIGHLADDFNWMADAMSAQMEKLQNEVHRQEEFTAAFAHELKTPLTSIIGYADTIRQMELSKEETDMCADYIFRQGKRLQTLSYKLLEMTMAGKQEIQMNELYVPEFLQGVAKTAETSLNEKQITLHLDAQAGVIYGDQDLLTSLFLNLIDNARKASEPGTSIYVTGEQEGNGYQIYVQDEGRGIPEKELERITEAFYMVDKSRARKEGGAGLGLALCQKIVELHQASWRFSSQEGQGLTVAVWFWNPEKPARRRSRNVPQERRARGRAGRRNRE